MNIAITGPDRPRLWPPKALLSAPAHDRGAPNLSQRDLRRIVAAMVG